MPQTRAEKRWSKLVEKHNASGLTTKAFAEQNNVNARTLAWWRSRLRRLSSESTKGTFVELEVAGPTTSVADDRTVVLAFDALAAHVVVDHDTDLDLLKRVLGALC